MGSQTTPYSPRMLMVAAIATLAAAVCLSGCMFSKMETARQLDQGETSVTLSGDVTPWFFHPRGTVTGTYGFGAGDISGHFGIYPSSVSFHVGGGLRLYPAPFLNLSLQGDLAGNPFLMTVAQMDDEGQVPGWFAVTPRLTTSTTDDRFVYGGVQASFTGWYVMGEGLLGFGIPAAVMGVEIPDVGGLRALQVELMIPPVILTDQRMMSPGEELEGMGLPGWSFAQLSVGGHFGLGESEAEPEPTQPYEPREPRQERRPRPDEPRPDDSTGW